jgi:hypothetical protein
MDETRTVLAVTGSGQQIIMTSPPFVEMGVIISDDPVTQTHVLAVDDKERAELIELADTNDIPDDTIKAKAINI